MSRIVTILRAAHCRSTHHYFAIDALQHIPTASGKRLGDLLLKYHDEYLEGAKAPDKSFRDFQNHVIHVGDKYWGGAAKSCEKWRETVLQHLNAGKWKKAAYACGVLSHYYTDPLMPLHTAQSDRESVVHRPMEWSVCKSYNEIYDQVQSIPKSEFQLATGERWISRAVIEGAEIANRHYTKLIDLYDLKRGCKNPPTGLNAESRKILATLFDIAISGWGAILGRLADEATRDIPECSLSLTTLLATIDMPLAWIVRKISDTSEQRAVKAIFREFESTGTVLRNLPPEIRTVATQRARESGSGHTTSSTPPIMAPNPTRSTLPLDASVKSPTARAADSVVRAPRASEKELRSEKPTHGSQVSLSSDLVDAPSIGPKTAARFEKIGITTIRQFLAANCEQLQHKLDTRWITAELLAEWQDQARLVCVVPALCGYKAQLLVAADCRSASELKGCNPIVLHRQIVKVCEGIDGKRILRSSPQPTIREIESWIHSAAESNWRAA